MEFFRLESRREALLSGEIVVGLGRCLFLVCLVDGEAFVFFALHRRVYVDHFMDRAIRLDNMYDLL